MVMVETDDNQEDQLQACKPHRGCYQQFLLGRGWDPRDRSRIPVGVREEFFSQLSEADFEACPYHQADWHAIAAEAVRIVRTMGESLREWEVRLAAEASSLSEGDRRWLLSLLGSYPITWSGDYFSDGQHRGCALRQYGAPKDGDAVARAACDLGGRHADVQPQGDGSMPQVLRAAG
jgi:hypothetical protein